MQLAAKKYLVGVTLVLTGMMGLPQAFCSSSSVELEWIAPTNHADGSPLTDLAGYTVYYGRQSGEYTHSLDVGNVTSTTISQLEPDTAYYFAVKAYESDGLESVFSEELAYQSSGLPVIVQHPQSVTVAEPNSAVFNARVVGPAPISYQWRRNGQPIAGARGLEYLLRICSTAHDGAQFDLVATNPYGSVTSQVAVLSVTPAGGALPQHTYAWFEVDPVSREVSPSAGSGEQSDISPGALSVTFDAAGGSYVVWARLVDAAEGSGSDGSFYVSMDSGPEKVWYIAGAPVTNSVGTHRWDVVSKMRNRSSILGGDAWVFNIASGSHTLNIRENQAGCLIDLLLVTSDLSWTPGHGVAADTDSDGLPDAWETTHLGSAVLTDHHPAGDADGDGVSNYDEFMAGSSAVDGLSYALVGMRNVEGRPSVVFEALQATGPGCEGKRRYYSLTTCSDLELGSWQPVQGYEAILARGQTIRYTADSGGAPAAYYRTRVWLE